MTRRIKKTNKSPLRLLYRHLLQQLSLVKKRRYAVTARERNALSCTVNVSLLLVCVKDAVVKAALISQNSSICGRKLGIRFLRGTVVLSILKLNL